jgi:hypothetical protein
MPRATFSAWSLTPLRSCQVISTQFHHARFSWAVMPGCSAGCAKPGNHAWLIAQFSTDHLVDNLWLTRLCCARLNRALTATANMVDFMVVRLGQSRPDNGSLGSSNVRGSLAIPLLPNYTSKQSRHPHAQVNKAAHVPRCQRASPSPRHAAAKHSAMRHTTMNQDDIVSDGASKTLMRALKTAAAPCCLSIAKHLPLWRPAVCGW